MKKTFLTLTLSISLFACSKTNSSCYVFESKQVTSIRPSMAGYPQTSYSTNESCGLSEDDAKQVSTSLTSTTQSTQGSYTVIITQTCTYHKK